MFVKVHLKFALLLFSTIASCIGLHGQDVLREALYKAYDSGDSSDYYYSKAYELLKTPADTAFYNYFRFYSATREEKHKLAKEYLDKAVAYFVAHDSLSYAQKSYQRRYNASLSQGNWDDAMYHIMKARDWAESRGDSANLAIYYADIGVLLHDMGNYDDGIRYGRKSANLAKALKDHYATIVGQNTIAINFDDKGNQDSAIFYHKLNLPLVGGTGDSSRVNFVFNNLGNSLLKKKQYKEALSYLLVDLDLSERNQAPYYLAGVYANLATVYIQLRNYDVAASYLIKGREAADGSESIEKLRDIAFVETEYYLATKQFEKALRSSEAYHAIKDSMLVVERQKLALEIEEEFATREKQEEILKQKAALAEREKANFGLSMGLIASGLIILIAILLFNRQRIKAQALDREKKLQEELAKNELEQQLLSQRLKISRDLHDNIGSQLTLISSGLHNIGSHHPELAKAHPRTFESAQNALNELRTTIWTLDEEHIYLADLIARIADMLQLIRESKPDFELESSLENDPFSETILESRAGVEFFRMIQEALHNAVKHNAGNSIAFKLTESTELLEVSIENPAENTSSDNKKGLGSTTLMQRAQAINAEINRSVRNGMFTVIIKFPFREFIYSSSSAKTTSM